MEREGGGHGGRREGEEVAAAQLTYKKSNPFSIATFSTALPISAHIRSEEIFVLCLQRYLHILTRSSIPVIGKMACTRRKQCIVSLDSYDELLWKCGLELVALVSCGAALIFLQSMSFQNRFWNSNYSLLWLKYDSGTTNDDKMIMGIIYPKRQKLKNCYCQWQY